MLGAQAAREGMTRMGPVEEWAHICRAGLLLLHELREPCGGAVEGMAVER